MSARADAEREALVQKLAEHLRTADCIRSACAAAGIAFGTAKEWLARGARGDARFAPLSEAARAARAEGRKYVAPRRVDTARVALLARCIREQGSLQGGCLAAGVRPGEGFRWLKRAQEGDALYAPIFEAVHEARGHGVGPNPELTATFAAMVRAGAPLPVACAAVGIATSAVQIWMQHGEAGHEPYASFLAAVLVARAGFEQECEPVLRGLPQKERADVRAG